MKVRYRKTGAIATSSRFNAFAVLEVLTEDDSAYVHDLDVWLEQKKKWKDMLQAFKDHDLITDNYNTIFFEPRNGEERVRGYSL